MLRLMDGDINEVERIAVMETMHLHLDELAQVHYVHPLDDSYYVTFPESQVTVNVRPHFVVHYHYGAPPQLSHVLLHLQLHFNDISMGWNVFSEMLLRADLVDGTMPP